METAQHEPQPGGPPPQGPPASPIEAVLAKMDEMGDDFDAMIQQGAEAPPQSAASEPQVTRRPDEPLAQPRSEEDQQAQQGVLHWLRYPTVGTPAAAAAAAPAPPATLRELDDWLARVEQVITVLILDQFWNAPAEPQRAALRETLEPKLLNALQTIAENGQTLGPDGLPGLLRCMLLIDPELAAQWAGATKGQQPITTSEAMVQVLVKLLNRTGELPNFT